MRMGLDMSLTRVGGGPSAPVSSALVITDVSGTTVTPQGSGVYRITKTGGVDGAFDASAITVAGFAADFVIRIQALQTTKAGVFGISSNPAADNSYTSVARYIYFPVSGSLEAGEFGNSAFGEIPAYTTADRYFIRRTGTTTQLLKGATDSVGAASVIYTWANLAGTVYFDSSLSSSAGSFDVNAVPA